MQSNFQACLGFTLLPANDGQPFHCTAGDSGAETCWGITRATLSAYRRRPVSAADVQALTRSSVAPIYRLFFWIPDGCDRLPAGIDLMVFDHGVVGGEGGSARLLQEAVGVPADGEVGPVTLAAITENDPAALIQSLADAQADHYRSLTQFDEFGRGWLARVARRRAAAMAMLSAASA